jgi:hypothetical protein
VYFVQSKLQLDRFQRIQEWSVIQLEKKKENYTVLERNFDFIRQKMKKVMLKYGIHLGYYIYK